MALRELKLAEVQTLKAREQDWRRQQAALQASVPSPSPVAPAPPAAGPPPAKAKPSPETQVWEEARLTWQPNTQEVIAIVPGEPGKKAIGKGRDLIPETVQKRLLKDRKAVSARVTVAPEGLAFRLVKIEAPS